MLDGLEDPYEQMEKLKLSVRHNIETISHLIDQHRKMALYLNQQSETIERLHQELRQHQLRIELLEGTIL